MAQIKKPGHRPGFLKSGSCLVYTVMFAPPATIAPKTMKRSARRRDIKGGGLLLMEGAKSLKIGARPFQIDVAPDNVVDRKPALDLLNRVHLRYPYDPEPAKDLLRQQNVGAYCIRPRAHAAIRLSTDTCACTLARATMTGGPGRGVRNTPLQDRTPNDGRRYTCRTAGIGP